MRVIFLIYISSLPLLFAGCSQGALGTNWSSPSNLSLTGQSTASLTNSYEAQAMTILQTNCFSCHTATTGPNNVYDFGDINHLVSAGLVVPGSPSTSMLYIAVSTSLMPPGGPLSSADQLTLSNWISGGSTSPNPTPTPTPSGPNPNATFTYINTNIINVSCVSCHGGFNTYSGLMAEVTASDPSSSALYNMVNSGQMPQGGTFLTADQIGDIYDWIAAGAPNN